MGKRKSSKKVVSRKGPPPLEKTFRCILCQHPGTVTCKIDKASRIGTLSCKNCGQSFSSVISHLTAPIDLYSDWIDAAAEANASAEANNKKKRSRAEDGEDESEDEDEDGGRGDARRRVERSESPDNDDQASRQRRREALDESDEELPEV